MIIKVIRSFSFVYLILSFEKYSIVINVAIRDKNDVHPAIPTPHSIQLQSEIVMYQPLPR